MAGFFNSSAGADFAEDFDAGTVLTFVAARAAGLAGFAAALAVLAVVLGTTLVLVGALAAGFAMDLAGFADF
ncbi:MAG TPA: hypothetical protein VGC24_09780 [Burkholderiaceae bacterium]